MGISFHGRVIVVTGAGRGLGASYARLLAAHGASVVVNDVGADAQGGGRDSTLADALVAEIEQDGGVAVTHHGDVSSPADATDLVATAVGRFGRLDGLIANAGTITTGDVLTTTADAVQSLLDVHLFGSLLTVQAAWPQLAARGHGAVLLTTSSAVLGASGLLGYSIAKGAVLGLMRSLACDGEGAGVRVNAIMPVADTRMQTVGRDVVRETATQRRTSSISAPDHAAPLACYLMHPSCPAHGRIFTAGRGRTGSISLASTPGPLDPHWTLEATARRFEEISDIQTLLVEDSLDSFRRRGE